MFDILGKMSYVVIGLNVTFFLTNLHYGLKYMIYLALFYLTNNTNSFTRILFSETIL